MRSSDVQAPSVVFLDKTTQLSKMPGDRPAGGSNNTPNRFVV